ncbi:unnamed protein product, partial [Ectocarpus sp. 8 AP-2014]
RSAWRTEVNANQCDKDSCPTYSRRRRDTFFHRENDDNGGFGKPEHWLAERTKATDSGRGQVARQNTTATPTLSQEAAVFTVARTQTNVSEHADRTSCVLVPMRHAHQRGRIPQHSTALSTLLPRMLPREHNIQITLEETNDISPNLLDLSDNTAGHSAFHDNYCCRCHCRCKTISTSGSNTTRLGNSDHPDMVEFARHRYTFPLYPPAPHSVYNFT